MDNKGRSALITLDISVALPDDSSDLSAGHSGLSPHLGAGGLFVPRAPEFGRRQNLPGKLQG